MSNRMNETDTTAPKPFRASTLGRRTLLGAAITIAVVVSGIALIEAGAPIAVADTAPPAAPPLAVSHPLERELETRLDFLGQFTPVNQVDLRAQVGGILKGIHFEDGDVVQEGDLLFEIDTTPYEIKLSQVTAQLESAKARLELATRELDRAEMLHETDAGSVQNVDQRIAEKRAAQAAMDEANALLRDAQFDLDHTRITAPFSGRMGTHLVSVGNLISGSRAGSSPTTLLATIVSLDPIYLNFDISEADYMAFIRERGTQDNPPSDQVSIALSDELTFDRKGTLTFIDNALNRSSGTIQARATVQNPDLLMTPGGFARVRVGISSPEPVLLVPDASVLPDQSEHIVLTVDADNVITPKRVEVGDLRGGLRVIRTGIEATDKIVIEGIPTAIPGTKVSPQLSVIEFGLDQE